MWRNYHRYIAAILLAVGLLSSSSSLVTAQAMSGCQLCASTGNCGQAFHNDIGQYCGQWQDQHSYSSSGMTVKPCCCPLDYQCKVSQFSCMCGKPDRYSNAPPQPLPSRYNNPNQHQQQHYSYQHNNSGGSTGGGGGLLGILFLLCLVCSCFACCRNKNNTSSSNYRPVPSSAPYQPPAYNPAAVMTEAYPVYATGMPVYGATDGGGVGSSAAAGAAGGLLSGALAGGLVGNIFGGGGHSGGGGGWAGGGWAGGGSGDIAGDSGGGGWDGGGGDIRGDS